MPAFVPDVSLVAKAPNNQAQLVVASASYGRFNAVFFHTVLHGLLLFSEFGSGPAGGWSVRAKHLSVNDSTEAQTISLQPASLSAMENSVPKGP